MANGSSLGFNFISIPGPTADEDWVCQLLSAVLFWLIVHFIFLLQDNKILFYLIISSTENIHLVLLIGYNIANENWAIST